MRAVWLFLRQPEDMKNLSKWVLMKKEIEYRVINPARVREFAKACGKLAKTDAVDAQILSAFAEKMEHFPGHRPSEGEILLKDFSPSQTADY